MSMIDKYLKQASGNWIKASNVQVGDQLQIEEPPTLDDQSFDKPYLVLEVTLKRTGEKYNLRLGTKNVARIVETLGTSEQSWTGNLLEVLSIENYPGLGQKGVLFRGVKAAKQATIPTETVKFPGSPIQGTGEPSLGAVLVIRQVDTMVKEGISMSLGDWNRYVKPEVQKELLLLGLVEELGGRFIFTEKAKKVLSEQ